MIFEAAKEFGFDPKDCYMVGDRQDDIDVGNNAGAKTILVNTGHFDVEGDDATYVAESLREAADYIVSH
jgi:phosphoglycolate phosphatase-like HAD superfamily hydrolase